ncbi:MAG: DIP1984 family protein [Ruminococcus sp.]|uniref:DIP1984 family protein n=1 Tax=Ruminococcus sp. TaxID=41978 RepID=UPI001B73CE44|nr:DIP1984 family protein [Ruminococcus sp.]MBO4494122.1 DIP1984 family protein [Ruminococcus sp.]MBP5432732.1 DIP1984 family protein [Ruminococcus sp.]
MKLAEALQERADLNISIEQLRSRLLNNVLVQENEKPAEDPQALLKELDSSVSRLEELMRRINHTNCVTISEEKSITELIAERDALKVKIAVYKDIVSNASQTAKRARMTEIKILSTVDVGKLQKKIDKMAKEFRVIDNRIQALNWSTELI